MLMMNRKMKAALVGAGLCVTATKAVRMEADAAWGPETRATAQKRPRSALEVGRDFERSSGTWDFGAGAMSSSNKRVVPL